MTAEKPALIEGVNELPGKGVPVLGEEGWLRHQEDAAKPPYKGADGVVVPDNFTPSTFTIMTTPSAPLRRLRAFFLLAQPPLLFQEGNTLSWQFIHTFIERRYIKSRTLVIKLVLKKKRTIIAGTDFPPPNRREHNI